MGVRLDPDLWPLSTAKAWQRWADLAPENTQNWTLSMGPWPHSLPLGLYLGSCGPAEVAGAGLAWDCWLWHLADSVG